MTRILFALSLVAVLLLAALGRANLRRVTVYEFERGLRYVRGRFTGIVEPGQYWTWVPTTTIRRIDMPRGWYRWRGRKC